MACRMGMPAVRRVVMVWANWLALDMRTTDPMTGSLSCARARASPPFSVAPASRREKRISRNRASRTSPHRWKKPLTAMSARVTQGSSTSRSANRLVKAGTA